MFTYSITVGHGKDKDGLLIKPHDAMKRLDVVRAHLAQEFGGFSESSLTGGYRMASGQYVEESATRWDIVADDAAAVSVRKWAGIVRDLFHQESVLLTRAALDTAAFV